MYQGGPCYRCGPGDPNPCGSPAVCTRGYGPESPDGFSCSCPSGSLKLHTFDDGRILCTQKSDLESLLNISGTKSDETSTGFKDCGKRLGQRQGSLGQSNGPSISALVNDFKKTCNVLFLLGAFRSVF